MPIVAIAGNNYNVAVEAPPHVLPGTAAVVGLQLSVLELGNLTAMRGFGRPDWNGVRPTYNDHGGSLSFGCRDDDYVITDAACWNWALTGATILDKATQVTPFGMFSLNALVPMVGGVVPALGMLDAGIGIFYNANQAAVNAWVAMPEGTRPQKMAKVETLTRMLCVAKGLTLAGVAATPYEVCCEYSVTLGDGVTEVAPNFDHWGLQINNAYSLQTLPEANMGIWKNSQESFVTEWNGGTRAVVTVPVTTLSAAHLMRIRGILAWNPAGAPRLRRLRCSVGACQRIHGGWGSVINLWHQCQACNKIFCDTCGKALERPAGGYFGRQMTQERECSSCRGRTALLSDAAQ